MATDRENFIVSIDLGTTALKVGLFSVEGELLRAISREQPLLFPAPDRVEQSPEDTWKSLSLAMRELVDGYETSAVSALAISNQRGTVIPLSSDGRPLSNLIVWMDKRGVPYVDWLEQHVSNELYYQTAGHPIVSYTGISKVLWVQRAAEEIWPEVGVIGPPQTLFLKRLGSEDLVCDFSTGTFLFPFDIERKRWSERLASRLDFPLSRLPKLVSSIDIVGHLNQDAAEDLGLRPGIPLVAGGGDGQCAGVGSGVVFPGKVMINIGTAAGVQTFLSRPVLDPAGTLNCAAHVVPDAWEMEGHTQASGTVFRWFRDEFGMAETMVATKAKLDAYDLLIEEAKSSPPGANGLLFLPTFNGSSAPQVDLNARGCLFGLTVTHSRGDIIRALLEGISFELRWMMDAIAEIGHPAVAVFLVGGGARNIYWNQIHADVLGKQINVLQSPEAALAGAAMCAAVAIGVHSNFQDAAAKFVKVAASIEPQNQNQEIYQSAYRQYKETFTLLSENGVFDSLSRRARTSAERRNEG